MNQNNQFEKDREFSEPTVDIVKKELRSLPWVVDVRDVSKDSSFYDDGVDLLVKRVPGDDYKVIIRSDEFKVEVKADRHKAVNIPFETMSNCGKGIKGCFLTSKADVWIYRFAYEGVTYVFDHKKALSLFESHLNEFPIIYSKTTVGNSYYRTECRLVPIDFLEKHKASLGLFEKWNL